MCLANIYMYIYIYMATLILLMTAFIFLVFSQCAYAKFVEETLVVESVIERRLCKDQAITVVNGSFPGPTIYAEEGDVVIIHVINKSPYDMTIHWHGVKQMLSCWADGTAYITQCPIRPGRNFTHRFEIIGQEGTLWWHAHIGFHRATVHGAIIVYPKPGRSYPFPKPDEEIPIILGEWWNENVTELEKQLDTIGYGPNSSDAFLINGYPGNLYSCSSHEGGILQVSRNMQESEIQLSSAAENQEPGSFKVKVTWGKTYLLRIISAAVNPNFFFAIANHKMLVVAADASYTKPYAADFLVVAPGQTYDILLVADQPPQQYYMATQIHRTSIQQIPNIIPASAILIYENANNFPPKFPHLPDMYDVESSFHFFNGLNSLDTGPFWEPVPLIADERMIVTVSLGSIACPTPEKCRKAVGLVVVAALNNESFVLPSEYSMLQAFYHNNMDGIYEDNFPSRPEREFDYTNGNNSFNIYGSLCRTKQSTKVKRVKFNSTIEIVFQGTSCVTGENHPLHLHGHNFYVLGQGFGNYNETEHFSQLNFENPVVRSTVDVLANGWVVIRFRADNPGVWYIHCHNEGHVPIGMATAFIVEDGPTLSTKLPPPPADLPQC